jgi:hypothetical protein
MQVFKDFFSPTNVKSKKKSFYKISGEASFKIEINVAGNPPYSNCILSVISLQNSANKLVIGSNCQWFRSFASQDVPLAGSGNTFRVSALDIGSSIKVRVTPTEPGEVGEAVVVFGPIKVDPNQKNTLKNIIKSGGAKFEFESISAFDTDEGLHAGAIIVFQTNMKFTMLNCAAKELRVYFGEQFELLQGRDDKTLIFKFNDSLKAKEIREFFGLPADQSPNTIKMKLISQLSRDNLIITLRSFEELIDLKDRLVLDKTLSSLALETTADSRRSTVVHEDIQRQLGSARLQRELSMLSTAHEQVETEKQRLTNLVNNLDGEISRSHFCRLASLSPTLEQRFVRTVWLPESPS